nr:retrovirus-related Pol polyprotein from transposon TNT 1-94 [Tanacetum cinerariifolium]
MKRFSSNDMVHNHYLEEAKKKTQERSRNSEPSLMPSARLQSTANGSKTMPRRNTQTYRNWPASKNSFVMIKTVPIAEHPRNSRTDSCQARTVKCYNCNGTGHIARNCTQPKRPQNSEYFKDKMLLMQAQENRVALDAEHLLFLADVDEAPTAQTMFMANLSSADPITDEARPSYDLDILFEYVKDINVSVVHSNASSVPNDTFMMIYDDTCEPIAPSISNSSRNAVVKNSLTAEPATYREQVELIGNHPPTPDKETPNLDSVFVIGKMQASLQGKDNAIRQLKKQLFKLQATCRDIECTVKVRTTDSQLNKVTDPVTNLQAQNDRFRAENDKVKQHYKQLNNRDAHLDYLRHLKESMETIHEIVEEAKVVRPLDRSIVSARRYTQHLQELLENDHFGAIMGYGDYVVGKSVISRVYYVEGLGHNLFSVVQFCDSNLEVAFRKHSCYVRDTNGVDLIKGSRGTNLYTISVEDMMKSSPICLLSKASKNKSWLWHRRLNHLNFGTINNLARKDLVRGLPRLKFEEDHLCSACQLGKSKKHTHKPKAENTNLEVLNSIHIDLCGPMRVQTINGKKYILVIVDDYSRFTWVKFLRSKDETPEVVIKSITQIQVGLNKTVRYARIDNGTEFVNHTITEYYERIGIFHQKTVPRTPQQNDVVKRRNRTLVEATRTMLIFSKAPIPKSVFGALCYPTNDSEDLGKLQPTADTGIFVGYAPSRKCTGPVPTFLTPGQISSGLVPNPVPTTPYAPPTNKELEILFQPMFDEYLEPPRAEQPDSPAQAV